MKRPVMFIAFAIAICSQAVAQNMGGIGNILEYFKNVAQYDSRCTQEKVYLHLDNNAYFIDENVYFKAYVVRASSLKYTDMSKVLYVELLDDHGNTVERKNYEIIDGQASGSIPLSGLIHGGFYEIRAFTRAMLNWDGNYCFSRVVPVYQTKEVSGDYFNPYIYAVNGADQLPMMRDEPNTLRGDSAKRNGVFVEMYPEGGALIEKNCPQKIAYRITDKNGNPVNSAECKIVDGNGETVNSKVMHEGMGELLISSWEKDLKLVVETEGKEREFNLPIARKSGISAVLQRKLDSLHFDINYTTDLEGQYVGVCVTCRGAACVFDTVRLDGKAHWEMSESKLHYGINQITLIDSHGDILWERLVWRKPDYPVNFTIKQNREIYEPYSPIVLDMKLADKNGNPCNAYFSLSVRDQTTEQKGNDCGIAEDLLLSSDIRGYVSRPELYFESDDEVHSKWLDLLLLVQGWRRYDFNEMAGKKPFKLVQPVETGQLLVGHLLENRGKRLPVSGADLKVDIFLPGLRAKGECKTDTNGSFALLPPKYYGEGTGRFYTYENGKPKTMRIFLDRAFAPKPRMFDVQEFNLNPYVHKPVAAQDETFAWNDTVKKSDIVLDAAVVRGKRKDIRDGQDKWNGGEGFAMRNADICYNIDFEAMKYCDKGEDDPLVWDLLKSINKNFDYTTADAELAGIKYVFTYRNRPAVVFMRNTEQNTDEHMDNLTLMASEVSRIYIVADQEKVRRVLPEYGSKDNNTTAIFLYGNGDRHMLKDKSKTKVVRFFGYSEDPEFDLPDYRKRDLPNPKDFRRTLYWNPDVLADKDGRATVMFYSNSRPGVKLGITARTVLPDGEIVDFER